MGDTRGLKIFFDFDRVHGKIFGGKMENLDREAVDRVVRVAREEYETIAETKEALSRAGVNVKMLELSSRENEFFPTSRFVLVKGLADSVSKSELVGIFGAYGALDKVIRPPTNTFALVIFLEPKDALICFTHLSDKPYKGKPLFLEYLDEDFLGIALLSESDLNNAVVAIEYEATSIPLEHLLETIANFDVDPTIIQSRTVLVSNLNFYTSDKELRRHFTDHIEEGRVLSARILRSMHRGKRTSCGIAFVELDSESTAVRVCKNLQGINLGYWNALKLCRPNIVESQDTELESCIFNTLLVHNFAPEATEKDFRDLFGLFGEVESVELIDYESEFGGRRPPFYADEISVAYVEFTSKQEALNALAHLRNARLYGRPLVGQSSPLIVRENYEFYPDASVKYEFYSNLFS